MGTRKSSLGPITGKDDTSEVVSLDADTRENAIARASNIVAEAAGAWKHAEILVIQFDSTLRGRVAEDCMTTLAGSGRRKMLVVPAFPSAGRTTRNGQVLVDGIPVHQTDFGRDPVLASRRITASHSVQNLWRSD